MPLAPDLHRLTDRCVLCAACAPRCPTYALSPREGESPRGRIALIAAVDSGRLNADEVLLEHLDHCLGCRACEAACPSGVAFGRIMELARGGLARRPGPARRLAHALLAHPSALRRALGGLRLLQRSGLWRLLAPNPARSLLPPLPAAETWHEHYPARSPRRGAVGLFLGCVNQRLGSGALRASIDLLTAAGYEVHIPRGQACCGALLRHAGDSAGANGLAVRNLRAFAGLPLEAVLHTASGCTAALSEYAQQDLPAETRPLAAPFCTKVADVSQFLAGITWPEGVRFRPLGTRVAVHSPCSLRFPLRQAEAPLRLLRHIPELDIHPLAENGLCCGGAGDYPLRQAARAVELRRDKLSALAHSEAPILLTSNIGCALHLAAGLREAPGRPTEVLHPVELLARQMDLAEATVVAQRDVE